MKNRKIDQVFFVVEVLFLLFACSVALYNIYTGSNTIPLLVILGGYILSIKGLRRVFVEKEESKKKSSRLVAFLYLTSSTFLLIHLSFLMI